MKIFLSIFVVICLSLFILKSLPWKNPASEKNISSYPIKIALSIWSGYALAYIAQEKGIFKKNNVEVELILKQKVNDVLEMLKNNEVDGVFDVFTDALVMRSQGYPVIVVYVTDYSNSGDVIIGRPNLTSLADLSGKKVSFTGFNTFSHVFVLKALENAGLKESQLVFEVVPEMDVLNALEHGEIDAGHTWEPIKSQALKKGYKILAKAGDTPGIITDVLFFHEEAIKRHPDVIKAIVESLLEAEEFLQAHPDESIQIMAQAENMTEEEMRQGLKGIRRLNLGENFIAMQPSDAVFSLYGSGKLIIDFLINRGQLSYIPDLHEMIDPQFIQVLIQQKER